MPFSIMKELLYDFINNIKYQILIQDKNKAFIEKRKRVEIYVKETKQLGLSDDEYLKKCYGEFKIKINAVVKEFKTEIPNKTKGCIVMDDPQWLVDYTEKHAARDTSGRGNEAARLSAMQKVPSHGSIKAIPEKNRFYRFAKKRAFFGLGAYG